MTSNMCYLIKTFSTNEYYFRCVTFGSIIHHLVFKLNTETITACAAVSYKKSYSTRMLSLNSIILIQYFHCDLNNESLFDPLNLYAFY